MIYLGPYNVPISFGSLTLKNLRNHLNPSHSYEADFCRPGPLTGRFFALSINTHIKHFTKTICVVQKNKAKARHVRGHGLHNILSM